MKTVLDISILAVNLAMMLAVGMGLETRHLVTVVRRQHLVSAALLGQMISLPLIGWCIARGLALPPRLSAGLLLLAACPVGDIANFYTALARANVALAVVVNTLSCLLASVTMAIVFSLYARAAGEHFLFAAPPLQLVIRVVLLTAVPIGAGLMLKRLIPHAVAGIIAVLQTACVVGIAGVVLLVVIVQADLIASDWKPCVVASLGLMIAAMATGWVLSRLIRLDAPDRVTFAVLFPVRNIALAMAVAVTILGHTQYAALAVVYFLTEVPLLLGVVAVHRRRQSRSESTACADVAP